MTSIGTTVPSETSYGQIVSTGAVVENTVAVSINDTEQIVRSYFEDIPVMVQVARCESTFRHTLADGSVLKGVVDPADTGVMQINKRYHEKAAAAMRLDLEDIYDNMAYARHLYETQGTQPWSASAPCWNQSLAMNI
ncbi:MAG: hypothetical protein UW75_C0029G0007 [Parcubacteria group bacterium GW2011_GWF2_44_8]|nr:MAG: hypothetical protein UW75_C0029G0007 [Parcubacteria group bacterium GW2011_GWF2_44_8]